MKTPSVESNKFSCPYCGAYAQQSWSKVFSEPLKNSKIPLILNTVIDDTEDDEVYNIMVSYGIDGSYRRIIGHDTRSRDNVNTCIENEKKKKENIKKFRLMYKKCASGEIYFSDFNEQHSGTKTELINLNISECVACNKISVWVAEKIVYPEYCVNIEPCEDMPDRVKELFLEASSIVNKSPIGASALLRLGLQYLIKELGTDGDKIHKNISTLYRNGTDPTIIKAMDSIRIIGNESVHPPITINVDDNIEYVHILFKLINIIVSRYIKDANYVNDIYNSMPADKKIHK